VAFVVGSHRHQQALIRELGAGCFGQIGDSDFAASDRQKRQLKLIELGGNILVANHCTLVDLELSGVGELIAHGDAVERYPQILALHCNVVGTDELQSANR